MNQEDLQVLRSLQEKTFSYFNEEINQSNGLVPDRTQPGAPASIAGVGLAISCFIVAIKKGWLKRNKAAHQLLTTLRFFANSRHDSSRNATGYKGFYYHFLNMQTGERAEKSELSTIDTALLMAGILSAAHFFKEHNAEENEIRELADRLYRRVDWQWALNGGITLCHGWKPEDGFLPYRWDRGYSEAVLLYVLAMGSPTYPISSEGYRAWCSTFEWREVYGQSYFHAGPLFIHQLSHLWIDFRDLQDDICRQRKTDYFENSRRATLIQRQYAVENPKGFAKYSALVFGLTASDGPGKSGKRRTSVQCGSETNMFYGYIARGVPDGPDDGTLSPWVKVASLPFAPEVIMPAIRYTVEKLGISEEGNYGLEASYNPSCLNDKGEPWKSPWRFALNQGPIILMIENFESGWFWDLMKSCPYIRAGLMQAGFRGGWLNL